MKTIAPLTVALALALISLASLSQASEARAENAKQVVERIEAAHGKAAWTTKDAIEADFLVEGFGGLRLEGTMLFTPSLSKVRMDLQDGTTLIYNKGDAWMTPADAEMAPAQARFHVLTWPYFVAVPFKLRDPGVNLTHAGPLPVHGPADARPAVRLTFEQGVGDAPDDWYYLLPNDRGELEALSYIVTFSQSQEEAETQPSVVLYDEFESIDGVTLPMDWRFHYWTKATGIEPGEPKGTAKLKAVRFVSPAPDAFDQPADAVVLPPPGS